MPDVRTPVLQNQFYRLVYDDAKKVYVKTTRWNTPYDNVNCMATQGSIAKNADSNGGITSSPPQIRNAQSDKSGGIGVDDVAEAWENLWGTDFWTPAGFNFADTINAVKQGRYAVVAMDYGYLDPADKWQAGSFGHALGLDHIRALDGAVGTLDSLGTRLRYIPQYRVRRAMEATARQAGRTIENLFVGFTRVRPEKAVVTTLKYGGELTGRGRFRIIGTGNLLAAPRQDAHVIRRLVLGEDMQVRQTSETGTWVIRGEPRWLGTADGLKWVWNGAAEFVGAYTGTEKIR